MVKNEKGVTLIELLAAIALLSIIILLTVSVHLFGQKQSMSQTKEIQNQSNIRLALNVITKEIRKASTVDVTTDSVTGNKILTLNGTDVYKLENNAIKKNGQILFENIQIFSPVKTVETITTTTSSQTVEKITLTISNIATNTVSQTSLSATIYIRN